MNGNHNEGEKKCACPNIEKVITCSYVDGLKCWNNLDKNEIWPKDNDVTMQSVTCNKSSLFAPKLNDFFTEN